MSTFSDSSSGSGIGRRRFLTTAAATGGMAALGLLGTSTASAQQAGLPPIDNDVRLGGRAVDAQFRFRGVLASVDFRVGMEFRVVRNPEDPDTSVLLEFTQLNFTAELPGDDGSESTVTIEQRDEDVKPKSVLRLVQRDPLKFKNILVPPPFTVTIEHPDEAPQVLAPKNPMKLIGNPTNFPPSGALYKLQDPVDLVVPDDPDTTIARIRRFPVKLRGV
ncbi:twin-arginine translocation signal domain-containing protein [Amycolatopsis sp. NPDC049868]|uniref:twin-arginine translocation signal domain-containing protein n=1 Tax=Amycolatopsis sp. NPDC049868 TaxID=3363934 RepID=UPI003795444A